MTSDATDIGRSGLIVLFGTGVSMFAFYLLRIALARGLPQDVFGAIILMLSVLDIAVMGCLFGLNQGLVKHLPSTSRGDSEQNTYITVSIATVIVTSVLLTAVGMLSLDYIRRTVFADSVSRGFVIITLVALPFYAIIKLSAGTLRGYQDTVSYTLVSKIALSGGRLLAAVAGLLIVGSGIAVVLGIVVAYVATAVFGLVFVCWSGWRPTIDTNVGVLSFFSFSLPLLFSSSLYILLTRADKLMIGYFTSATATVGQYEVAVTIASLLTVFHKSFSFLLFPRISELVSDGKQKLIPPLYNQATRWILVFTTPLLSVIILRPAFFVDLFGNDYALDPVYVPISILAGAKLVDSVLGPNGQALLGFGKSRTVFVYNCIAVSVNIVLNILLIPVYGIVGAAISSLVGYLCMNLLKTGDLYLNHQFDLFDRGSVLYTIVSISSASIISVIVPETGGLVIEVLFVVAVAATSLVTGVFSLYKFNYINSRDKETVKNIFDTLSNVR
ncbi:flippase [Halopiger djelfimassiliensis]|uniref:flippase n=1 Tax=Halopiger djelfimassiliensis TaxID=1293047 RepID=UPI0009DBA5A7|nr:flippase [Halopiger djelfimassiliensis]